METAVSFRVATCEFPDRADAATAMWRRLEAELAGTPVDLLVLPELAGVDSFWVSPDFDDAVWRQAVSIHATISEELERIAANRIVGTRALEVDRRRWNETFLWKSESGLARGRPKAWLPEQEEAGRQPGSTGDRRTSFRCGMASFASRSSYAPRSWSVQRHAVSGRPGFS